MSAIEFHPIDLAVLLRRLRDELAAGGPVYGLPRKDWWSPDPRLALVHFGRRVETPVGPASGPHTQLAQNFLPAWLAGARFFELKTVQVRDRLDIPRPCISVPNIGYNVEWSQELRVGQSAREYVKAWILLHAAARALGRPGPGAIFDVSLGYDLDGLRSEAVRGFQASMADAGDLVDALLAELPAELRAMVPADLPRRVSDTVTLSTFHGCPADEIEAMAAEMLDRGWHTVVKLNPTLLGHEAVRALLDRQGYADLRTDPADFARDLQWEALAAMIPRLRARAARAGLGFGVKLTNTLVTHDPDRFPGQSEVYVSGAPLHAIAVTLARDLRARFPDLPITFSAGVDRRRVAPLLAAGIAPITASTDLLKGKGYARVRGWLAAVEAELDEAGAADLAGLRAAAGPDALPRLAEAVADDPGLSAAAHGRAPRKVDSHLAFLDCLTCDRCLPVCPNLALLAVPVPTGRWSPGRVRWRGADFTVEPGEELVVGKRHQIVDAADACNLCGNCDTWCPEHGGPQLAKPALFLGRAAWEERRDRDGFLVEDGGRRIAGREGGEELVLERLDDGWLLRTEGGSVRLEGDRPVATEGAGEVDLARAVRLRLFLEAFTAMGPSAWLDPGR